MTQSATGINSGSQSVNNSSFLGVVTKEMSDYFNSPLDAGLFLKAVDSFVRLSKAEFISLFTGKFTHYASVNNIGDKQKCQLMKNLKLDLGKALMSALGVKSDWFFKSRN